MSPGVVVGAVTASATTGALVALGHRAGGAGLPFAAIGGVVLHRTATAGSTGLVVAGVLLHVAAMFLLSFAFVWIVEHYLPRETVAAFLIGAAQFLFSWVVALATANGVASVLPLGDRIVFSVILAAGLVVGIRFAFPRS